MKHYVDTEELRQIDAALTIAIRGIEEHLRTDRPDPDTILGALTIVSDRLYTAIQEAELPRIAETLEPGSYEEEQVRREMAIVERRKKARERSKEKAAAGKGQEPGIGWKECEPQTAQNLHI